MGANSTKETQTGAASTTQVQTESPDSQLIRCVVTCNLNGVSEALRRGATAHFSSNEDSKPLHTALQLGHLIIAEKLIEAGAYVLAKRKSDGYHPLHIAAERGYSNIVRKLLRTGASSSATTNNDDLAIHLAIRNNHLYTVGLLAENKADLRAKDGNGNQALHIAVVNGDLRTVELLVTKGANVLDTNLTGDQALHLAASWNHLSIVSLLLKAGASTSAKNSSGHTATEISAKLGYRDVLQAIQLHESKLSRSSQNIPTASSKYPPQKNKTHCSEKNTWRIDYDLTPRTQAGNTALFLKPNNEAGASNTNENRGSETDTWIRDYVFVTHGKEEKPAEPIIIHMSPKPKNEAVVSTKIENHCSGTDIWSTDDEVITRIQVQEVLRAEPSHSLLSSRPKKEAVISPTNETQRIERDIWSSYFESKTRIQEKERKTPEPKITHFTPKPNNEAVFLQTNANHRSETGTCIRDNELTPRAQANVQKAAKPSNTHLSPKPKVEAVVSPTNETQRNERDIWSSYFESTTRIQEKERKTPEPKITHFFPKPNYEAVFSQTIETQRSEKDIWSFDYDLTSRTQEKERKTPEPRKTSFSPKPNNDAVVSHKTKPQRRRTHHELAQSSRVKEVIATNSRNTAAFSKPEKEAINSHFTEGMHQTRVVNPTSQKVTRWSYHHLGDVDIPEICVYSIDNRCRFEKKGCNKLHCRGTSHWQIFQGLKWINLLNFHSKQIEDAFVDVNQECVILSPIHSRNPGVTITQMLKILGNDRWQANFETMVLIRRSSPNISYTLRRLSTPSAAVSRSAYATIYEWYFLDNYKWVKYGENAGSETFNDRSNISSEDIEVEYTKEKSISVYFQTPQFQYSIDLKTMQQTNMGTQKVRPVRRRPVKNLMTNHQSVFKKENNDLPSHWSHMQETDTMILVTLQPSSQEFREVMMMFRSTVQHTKIHSIKRVQSPFLWRPFKIKEKELIIKYGRQEKLDIQKLFHGTKGEYITNICKENFDWRLHGSNVGQLYGQGAYFSNSAMFASSYSTPDSRGSCFMFLVEVIVGKFTKGDSSMKRPPNNPRTGELYDTTVDNISDPKIFVKYDKQEYCPLYVIEYA